MDGFFSALSASLVLLMLMSVGYFMGRLGWMTAAEKRFLSKFIVNIAVPCNCITGLLNNLDHDSLLQAGLMVASAMVGVAVTLALCLLLAKLLRLPRERWGVFVAMAAFSNTLFIGLPVSTQLFGDVCVPYVMMYYLANTLSSSAPAPGREKRPPWAASSRTSLPSPPFWRCSSRCCCWCWTCGCPAPL